MNVSRILLYYSFIITGLLILTFVVFTSTISLPATNLPKQMLILNENSNAFFTKSGGLEMPYISKGVRIIQTTSLENYYVDALIKRMPLLIVCLITMLIVGTLVLYGIMKRQSERQALFLAKELADIGGEGILPEQHPAVAKAYREIRDRLEADALDYIRLSSYVTHEQKNILSLLRARLQLSENPSLTSEVDKVTDSLDDILTLSASKNRMETEPVDTALICADICDEYRRIYPNIVFDFDDDSNNMVHARGLWINRAVSNLVSNAVKYGENGRISVSVANRNRSVIIAVSDEGPGIPEEEQEKLFDYQYRVGKLKKDGYGIGLSLVRHVCELCGGLCWVENGKEKGTTFYMILPEAREDGQ